MEWLCLCRERPKLPPSMHKTSANFELAVDTLSTHRMTAGILNVNFLPLQTGRALLQSLGHFAKERRGVFKFPGLST